MNTADTPAGRLARLDASLAAHGEDVVLRRRVGTSDVYVNLPLRARVTGYQANELVNGIKQTDQRFIISPSPITAGTAIWPGAAAGDPMPTTNDFLVVAGRQRKIEQVAPQRVGGAVVRIEGRILG